MTDIPLPFPLSGVVLDAPQGTQPPGTTSEGQNVRGVDPLTRRSRGAQRAGISRYVDDPIGSGPVLDMNQIVTDAPRVIYSQNGYSNLYPILTRWSTALDRGTFPVAINADLDGRVYTFDTRGNLSQYNRAGVFVRSFAVPGSNDSGVVYDAIDKVAIDEAGGIYVAMSKSTGGVETKIYRIKRVSKELGSFKVHWTVTTTALQATDIAVRAGILVVTGSASGTDHRLLKYVDIFNSEPTLAWNVDITLTSTAYKPRRIALGSHGSSYICYSPDSGVPPYKVCKWYPNGGRSWATEATLGGAGVGIVLTEENDVITCGPKDGDDVVMRKILDLGTSFSTTEHTKATGTLTLTDAGADGETVTIGQRVYTLVATLDNSEVDQVLIGADANGTATNLKDAIMHTLSLSTYSDATTVNLDVVATAPGAGVVSVTAKVGGTDGNGIATTTTASGASWGSATLTGGAQVANGGAWVGEDSTDIYDGTGGSMTTTLVLDSHGDVYAAVPTVGVGRQIEKRQGDSGHFLFSFSPGDDTTTYAKTISLDNINTEPVYRTLSVTGPKQMYIATSSAANADNIYGMKIVGTAHDLGPNAVTRITVNTALCGGDLVTFQRDGVATVPSGGTSVVERESIYLSSTVAFGKLYFTDGVNDWVYDPEGFEETPRRDTVEEWVAEKGGGEMPPNAKLLTTWSGRVFRARFTDDGQNWAGSYRGNPLRWAFFESNPTDLDAVIGNDSRIGPCPDIINTLMPYSDDQLFFGCDHSIHAMVGDPGSRGQFVLVSDVTGVAFGMPHTKDPSGVWYFFGSRGGVYALVPGGIPEKITTSTVDAELLNIDLTRYRVEMQWDTRLDALHVWFLDRATPSAETKHWVWERKRAWWWDKYGSASLQPTSTAVFDGDEPDDRVVAIGCYDGRVRYINENALSDDGTRIESMVTIGPIAGGASSVSVGFKSLQAVLASNQDGCRYEWLVGDSPDDMAIAARGSLEPGQNPVQRARRRGNYVSLRLVNASLNERWAFESAVADAIPFGRRRART